MRTELVKHWMTHNPVVATPATTLPEAVKIMGERHIRRLPVLDKGKLAGIVTRGDIRGAEPSGATSLSIWEINYLLSRLTLGQIMTRKPITVTPDSTIGEAARLMLQHKIAGLPVLEAGQVVGILTESDIFRLVVNMWEKEEQLSMEPA